MNNEELLRAVVSFYRKYRAGNACQFSDDYFSVKDLVISEDECWQKLQGVDFEQILINGKAVNTNDHPDLSIGDKISFTLIRPRLVFDNVNAFVNGYPQLQKGLMPSDFYLLDQDLLYSEDNIDESLENLINICRLIRFFEQILPHTEKVSSIPFLKFVLFSRVSDSKRTDKKVFSSKFTAEELNIKLNNLEFILSLAETNDLHSYERVIILQNALFQLLRQIHDEQSDFPYILKHFNALVDLYKNNYETYINNFHLEDFKKEVVESYSKFSDEIDDKVNDLVSKFTLAPAISTVLLFLKATNGSSHRVLVGIVLLVVFLTIVAQANWSLKGLRNIDENLKAIFTKFRNNQEEGGKFVDDKLTKLEDRIIQASFLAYSSCAITFVLCVILTFAF